MEGPEPPLRHISHGSIEHLRSVVFSYLTADKRILRDPTFDCDKAKRGKHVQFI